MCSRNKRCSEKKQTKSVDTYYIYLEIEKDQVVFYAIELEHLQFVRQISKYESPLNGLKDTVRKLTKS